MVKRVSILFLLALSFMLVAQSQQAPPPSTIVIQNPSFEVPLAMSEAYGCNAPYNGQPGIWTGYQPGIIHLGRKIPEWNQNYGAAVTTWTCLPQPQFRIGNPLNDNAYLPPDGQQVAFLGYASNIHQMVWQDLGVPLQRGIYNLKVYIANWGYSYPGKVRLSITVGPTTTSPGHELCHSEAWALGAWTEVTLNCPVAGYLETNSFGWSDFGNGHVGIAFQHADEWIVLLDEVSMTLTDPAFVHN